MTFIVQISLLAMLLAVCYGRHDLSRWFRKGTIQEFMTQGSRIWLSFTSITSGQSICIFDNVHNATEDGVAFVRHYVNRSNLYEQDFYVQQRYGHSLNSYTMVVEKTSGYPQNVTRETLIFTNPWRTCGVFFVESLTEPRRKWCDLRVNNKAINYWIPPGCLIAFYNRPCYGRKIKLINMCVR
ncbi:uncharacterized protein LOC144141356 isoform X2 [Haemaphysalis longicornis]